MLVGYHIRYLVVVNALIQAAQRHHLAGQDRHLVHLRQQAFKIKSNEI